MFQRSLMSYAGSRSSSLARLKNQCHNKNQLPLLLQCKQTVGSRKSNLVMIPWYHDTTIINMEDGMLEAIRKAVKQIGKEPATQRLTLEEKNALRAIEFTYGQQGIMTSGNEIIRIGMNFILKDYQKNGENSILAKVLLRLNS